MSYVHVHYRPSDGEIFGFENTINPEKQPGCEIRTFFVEDWHHVVPDGRLHKIDPASLDLVDKTTEERAQANAPTDIQVRQARCIELREFDWRESHPEWKEHRQVLRDITKAGDAIAMVKAWPLRPDDTDAIPHLRARLP